MVSGKLIASAAKQPAGAKARARTSAAAAPRASAWVPERQDVIWIDCNPQAGSEMRDMHPMLVLSPGAFNARTDLVIGLPMTTAAFNASNPFALCVGTVTGRKAGKTSYVLCHQPKSFDWRARRAKPHPLGRLADAMFEQACDVLGEIIGIA